MSTDVILILGMLIVGLPILIIGCVAAWRDHQIEKMS
jgi:hypothetical protein